MTHPLTFALACLLSAWLILSLQIDVQTVITPDTAGSRAELFTQLLDRSEGWLAADGIYSIPLNGNDRWASADTNTHTLFVFSDTLLGSADPKTDTFKDARMVNHSAALLTNYDPGKTQQNAARQTVSMQFIFGTQGDGTRSNIFEKKYWLQDGIVIANKLYLTGFRPNERWKPTQIDLFTIPLSPAGLPDWKQITVTERVPLLFENEECLVLFGIGILDHTVQDGFIYIYGYRDHLKHRVKHLVAARVSAKDFAEIHRWQFWSGKEWSPDIEVVIRDEAALAGRISTELSVTPLEGTPARKDQYLLVFVQDVMSGKIAYKLGSSPIGPFGETVVFYQAPEQGKEGKEIYVYNAKAHPHLSGKEALLISYNVNRFGSLPHNTNEYRPRFIELPISAVKTVPPDPSPAREAF